MAIFSQISYNLENPNLYLDLPQILDSRFKWAAKVDVRSSGLRNSPLSAPESDPGLVVGVLDSSLPLRGITSSSFTALRLHHWKQK
jgi:hypothetical protein